MMRPLAVVGVLLLLICAIAVSGSAIQGTYAGDWSGASGAGGGFKLSVTPGGATPKCAVSFTYAGEEVKTNVTLCKTDGPKIEAKYDFDLGGNRLQSTIQGELKENALAGTYQTVALADGSAVDHGDWKAAPVEYRNL